MAFLNIIEDEVRNVNSNSLKSSCNENNCSLNLQGFSRRLIIKGEEIRDNVNESICDCIIYTSDENFIIGNIELKSKGTPYDQIEKKFENTPKYTERFLVSFNEEELGKYQYFPIVLAKRWDSISKRKFKNCSVRFKGKNYKLILRDCGNRLKDIIIKYT